MRYECVVRTELALVDGALFSARLELMGMSWAGCRTDLCKNVSHTFNSSKDKGECGF
jgi:hypothetical protein